MNARFIEVPAGGTAAVLDDPDLVRGLLDSATRGDLHAITIEGAWPGFHVTLSGEPPIPKEEALEKGVTFPASPYENVLMGGSATLVQSEFGAVRYQSPEEIRGNAELLAEITVDEFMELFDPDFLDSMGVPPDGWSLDADREAEMRSAFLDVVTFHERAADHGSGVLIVFE